jgi:hypothetical protein
MPELSTGIGDTSAALAIVDLPQSRSYSSVKKQRLKER